MAEIQVYRRNVVPETPGVVRFDTSARGFDQAAAQLNNAAAQFGQDAQAGAAADAFAAGKKAGLAIDPNGAVAFDLLPNDSASNRAFNEGAIGAYRASIGNLASKRAGEVAANHTLDPEGFQKSFQADMEGRLASVPERFKAEFQLSFANYGSAQYRSILASKVQHERNLQGAEFTAQDNLLMTEGYESFSKGGTFDKDGASTGIGESYRQRFEQAQEAQVKAGFLTPTGKVLKLQQFDAKMRVGHWNHVFDQAVGPQLARGNIGGALGSVGKVTDAIRKDPSIPTDEKVQLISKQLQLYNQQAANLQARRAEGDRAAGEGFMRDLSKNITEVYSLPEEERAEAMLRLSTNLSTRGRANLELQKAQQFAAATKGVEAQQKAIEAQQEATAKAAGTRDAQRNAITDQMMLADHARKASELASGKEVLNEDGTRWDPSVSRAVVDNIFAQRVQTAPEGMDTHYMQSWMSYVTSSQKVLESMSAVADQSMKTIIGENFGTASKISTNLVGSNVGNAIQSNMLNSLPESTQALIQRIDQISPGAASRIIRGSQVYNEMLNDAAAVNEIAKRLASPNDAVTPDKESADRFLRVSGNGSDPKAIVMVARAANALPSDVSTAIDSAVTSNSVDAIKKAMELHQFIEANLPTPIANQAGSAYSQGFLRRLRDQAFLSSEDVDLPKMIAKTRETMDQYQKEVPKVLQERSVEIERSINDLQNSRVLYRSDLGGPKEFQSAGSAADGVVMPPSFRQVLREKTAENMALNPRMSVRDARDTAWSMLTSAEQGGNPVYGLSGMAGNVTSAPVVVARPIEIWAKPDVGGKEVINEAAAQLSIIAATGMLPKDIKGPMITDGERFPRAVRGFLESMNYDPTIEDNPRYSVKPMSVLYNQQKGGYEIYYPNQYGALDQVRRKDGSVAVFSAEDFKLAYKDSSLYKLKLDAARDANEWRKSLGLGNTPQPLIDLFHSSYEQMLFQASRANADTSRDTRRWMPNQ